MIKAIILDIDGVIVGDKVGFNSPYPHPDVIKRLKDICLKGIPISLCTAKPYYSISEIIKGANLNNPHITDAGAVIINPINNVVIEKHVIDKTLAERVLEVCLGNKIYVEFYTVDDYYIQNDEVSDITKIHNHILQKKPQVVSSLVSAASYEEVTKIIPIAIDAIDKERVSKVLEPFLKQLSISWTIHPIALPLQFSILTALGCSKKEGVQTVAKSLNISLKDILGVGDSTSDWNFIQRCGFAATLENGSKEIQELVKTKGEDHYFVGPSVDDNGILEIVNYFAL